MSTTKIKEIRTAAGMSQKALAKEAGVTVYELSKTERGIKELTPDKLDSVAKALNVTAESLQDPAPHKEETPVIAAGTLTAEELELLDLYRSADAEKRQMAIAILKGTMGSRDYVNFLAGMLKSGNSAELLNAVKSMIMNSKVEDLLAIAKNLMAGKNGMGLMSALTGMPGGITAEGAAAENGADRSGSEISTPLLAFTYFYACSIYILLLSFYFWQWRRDIKPEK